MTIDDIGTLTFGSFPSVKIDRLAIDSGGRLLFASIVGDTGIIKGIRAQLHSDKDVTAGVKRIKVRQASAAEWDYSNPEMVSKRDGGYRTEFHRLPYHQAHAFIMSRANGFLLAATPEHTWATINDGNRFTTPLLPEWTPWITEQLKAGGYLVESRCHRCSCATLNINDAGLDAIVSRGIKEGELLIPGAKPRPKRPKFRYDDEVYFMSGQVVSRGRFIEVDPAGDSAWVTLTHLDGSAVTFRKRVRVHLDSLRLRNP